MCCKQTFLFKRLILPPLERRPRFNTKNFQGLSIDRNQSLFELANNQLLDDANCFSRHYIKTNQKRTILDSMEAQIENTFLFQEQRAHNRDLVLLSLTFHYQICGLAIEHDVTVWLLTYVSKNVLVYSLQMRKSNWLSYSYTIMH